MFYGLKCLMNLELIEWKAGCLWGGEASFKGVDGDDDFHGSSNFEGKGTKSFGNMRFLLFFPVFAYTPVTEILLIDGQL